MARAVVPVLVLLAACSSGKSPAERLAAAPQETVAEETAKLLQRVRVTPPADAEEDEPVVLTGRGSIDFANRRSVVTTTVDGQPVASVFEADDLYQHLPNLALAGGGKEWFEIDFDTLRETAGVKALGDVLQTQTNDPAVSLHLLRGVEGDVEKIGEERIRGVNTRWYGARVSLAAAAEAAPAEAARRIELLGTTFSLTSVPVEVWVDSDGRVRRILQTFDYSKAVASGDFEEGSLPDKVETTLEFYDFRTPVTVDVPTADEVAQLSDALARIQRGDGSGTASAATDALVGRLLSELPDGYEQQPDVVGDTGPSDLEKAIRDDTESDARQVLTDDRFVAGYQRLWAKGNDSQIIDFVYQFEQASGATHYMERIRASITEDEDTTTPFEVPGIPGAVGVRSTGDENQAAVVLMTRGPFMAQVVVSGPDSESSVPLDLARQQYEKLG